jgi:hypothetical protein
MLLQSSETGPPPAEATELLRDEAEVRAGIGALLLEEDEVGAA